ncbi:hypothetical protein ISN45_At02g029820 [Arabidopsis thaliana x Arabidopsis arenosa]|uniref:Uncharacterized protein n=2 Tax=Arabidopsis TaxID=3701 RepID=A0A8T2G3E2_ARASU|nr:hypothetical protein ISN45_At02g029820 [Arabidopsis thaliana x Arabidopsis arenosa]KAG7643165.1 hypothetical protein ISN44_As02g030070 [Arabidopsis suecica]
MTSKPITRYKRVNYGGKKITSRSWGKCKTGSLGNKLTTSRYRYKIKRAREE